ncbi:hypothetical protein LN040_12830 [Desulfovibrio subterraneus]|uniref:TOPRIM nucleotidyl transferase/hydrolase domain-containing protein n=1 Tax=Desulfovibrio subterraneus TaxID=2718620 RepID=UPI0022B8EFF4|nr:TOPRIM nucleotidyl transferase/hydrolase domain-containing protein [Desulfovibrio subterraneus]WBF66608.1 hypothetical protein LN040_12830 [Desulfovibrio subterraneus]
MNNTLSIPDGAIRAILGRGGVRVFGFLDAAGFVQYCTQRGLKINIKRLHIFEKIGVFLPYFRVKITPHGAIRVSEDSVCELFNEGVLIDTSSKRITSDCCSDIYNDTESYYSIFQVCELDMVMKTMTLSVHLDSWLECGFEGYGDSRDVIERYARNAADGLVKAEHRVAVGMLCQYISDRYGPQSQSDLRSIRVPGSPIVMWYRSIVFYDGEWNWSNYVEAWDPDVVKQLFSLTRENLKHAYRTLCLEQKSCDPLSGWYKLMQFVSLDKRKMLKNSALLAETLRCGCYMVRLLYKDLFNEELAHPNEFGGMMRGRANDDCIKGDIRKGLEYVVNSYNLNPQPKVVLLVEGESEVSAISEIFNNYYGHHYGVVGIEVLSIDGVDNATGSRLDRFGAILRLVDYLHTHQTFVFIILDNENNATKLKNKAKISRSIFNKNRMLTRGEYIKIWSRSFEFDNFSCTEIASALTEVAKNNSEFKPKDIVCIKNNKASGDVLSKYYKEKTGYGLNKIELSKVLIANMLSNGCRRLPHGRPIIKILNRVCTLAVNNPFPVDEDIREGNQMSKYLAIKIK